MEAENGGKPLDVLKGLVYAKEGGRWVETPMSRQDPNHFETIKKAYYEKLRPLAYKSAGYDDPYGGDCPPDLDPNEVYRQRIEKQNRLFMDKERISQEGRVVFSKTGQGTEVAPSAGMTPTQFGVE
jgi:hypothetical protein